MSGVGERVRRVREELGWTQAKLAKNARVGQSTIAELEKGTSKGSAHIVKIALALGVSAYWLDSGKGRKKLTDLEAIFLTLSEREQEQVLAMIRLAKGLQPQEDE